MSLSQPYHLLCYSQGGIICRTFLQLFPDQNVQTFFSISSPLMGQYGATSFDKFFPGLSTKDAYLLFYTHNIQQHVSIANFWRDPFHYDLYMQHNMLLPYINGESGWHQQFTINFANIQQIVLIGGPQDGVITPWQSAHFESYAWNDTNTLIPMQQQPVYKYLALSKWQQANKLHLFTVPNIVHLEWPRNEQVFMDHILPYLY